MDQSAGPLVDETPRRDDAAAKLQALAVKLGEAGYHDASQLAYQAAASLDLTDAELQKGWGGPLNGQRGRCKAFLALVSAIEAVAIVETGTYRGISTEWMAENFAGPIHTCELDPRFFYQARQKLSRFPQVVCELKDSRAFLQDLIASLPSEGAVLFYLDAHWSEDLPLREEVEIILSGHAHAVIMIDDFAVPYDHGYRWDDYGPGKRLTLEILEGTSAVDAQLSFPSLPSGAETGAKRGCVLVTNDTMLASQIEATEQFRSADWREWRLVELGARVEDLERENMHLQAQHHAHIEEKAAWALANAEAADSIARAGESVAHLAARAEHDGAQALASRNHAHALALEKAALEQEMAALMAEIAGLRETVAERDVAVATLEASLERMGFEAEARQRGLAQSHDQLAHMTDQLKVMRAYVGIIE